MIHTLQTLADAAHGHLHGPDRAFKEIAIDSRKLGTDDLFAALRGSALDGHDFVAAAQSAGAAGALVARPLPLSLPQVVVADVEAALAAAATRTRTQFAYPLIGVAGSNGKTTVKEMLAAILSRRGACLCTRGNLNNHLGVPMTLLRLDDTHRSAVIEMGANRAGDVQQLVRIAQPTVGLITNAGAEHLEGFGSLEGVARAEGEMVADLPTDAVAVINADDAFAPLWRASTAARVVSFGLSAGADFRAEGLQFRADADGFATRFTLRAPLGHIEISLALAGRHNVINALAAAAGAVSAGASLAEVAAGLALMRAVKGRLQFRRTKAQAWLIDDTYNANPSSLQAALAVLAELTGPRWLVLGDMVELGAFAEPSHRDAGAAARAAGVERLFTFGGLAALAAESFGEGAQRFADIDALTRAVQTQLSAPVRLLIKGSRVNRLERLVGALALDSDAIGVG